MMKDMAEHLRTVHFTLTVTAIALLISPLFGNKGVIDSALDQIHEIIDTRKIAPTWFAAYVDESVKASNKLKPFPPAFQIELEGTNRIFTVDDYGDVVEWSLPIPLEDAGVTKQIASPYSNLTDFKNFWNALQDIKHVHIPNAFVHRAIILEGPAAWGGRGRTSNEWVLRRMNPFVPLYVRGVAGWQPVAEEGTPTSDNVFLDEFTCDQEIQNLIGQQLQMGIGCAHIIDLEDDRIVKILIPVRILDQRVFPQDQFLKLLQEKNHKAAWLNGSFSYTFRELDTLTQNYQDLSPEKIELILQNQRAREGETLQLVGVKIPAEAFRPWGLLILIGIQVYFVLHLREFMRRDPGNRDVAWIAFYPDRYAKVVLWLSIFLLPAAAAGTVGYATVHSSIGRLTQGRTALQIVWKMWPFALGFLATLMLAIVSWRIAKDISSATSPTGISFESKAKAVAAATPPEPPE